VVVLKQTRDIFMHCSSQLWISWPWDIACNMGLHGFQKRLDTFTK